MAIKNILLFSVKETLAIGLWAGLVWTSIMIFESKGSSGGVSLHTALTSYSTFFAAVLIYASAFAALPVILGAVLLHFAGGRAPFNFRAWSWLIATAAALSVHGLFKITGIHFSEGFAPSLFLGVIAVPAICFWQCFARKHLEAK